jgi:hypothetical protein
MKTLLFAPMYLDDNDRLERNLKWLRYYTELKGKLHYDEIFLVDNASSQENINQVLQEFPDVKIHRCKVHLGRPTTNAYGYWYSAFGIAARYAKENGFDKIVHADSDVYLFTTEICDYVNKFNSGWVSMWCEMHNYPESTFQMIGKDQFDNVYNFMTRDFLEFYPNDMAETRIPWTHVEKSFKGDRYGEKRMQQEDWMDWYGQCEVKTQMKFRG